MPDSFWKCIGGLCSQTKPKHKASSDTTTLPTANLELGNVCRPQGSLEATTSIETSAHSPNPLALPGQQPTALNARAGNAAQDTTSSPSHFHSEPTASQHSFPPATDQSGRHSGSSAQHANLIAPTTSAPAAVQAPAMTVASGGTIPNAPTQRSSSGALQPLQDSKLHIPLSDLLFHELIGSSSNKTLYRGSWIHTSVGILVIRFSGVVANARTLQRLSSHPNLVQFYRWTTAEHGRSTCLVVELVRMGALDSLLIQYGRGLHNRSKLLMCEQVASAMCELVKEGVTHGNLSAHNVLAQSLDPVHVKVSDFEMACILAGSESAAAAARFTPRRARTSAPEVLAGGLITEKSDVWSFGFLMWVICSNGAKPFSDKSDKEVWELMQQCWHQDPAQRPLFSNISQTFQQWRSAYSISRHRPHFEVPSGDIRSPSNPRRAFINFTVSAPENIQTTPFLISSPEITRLMRSEPFLESWGGDEPTSSSGSPLQHWTDEENTPVYPSTARHSAAPAATAAALPAQPDRPRSPPQQQRLSTSKPLNNNTATASTADLQDRPGSVLQQPQLQQQQQGQHQSQSQTTAESFGATQNIRRTTVSSEFRPAPSSRKQDSKQAAPPITDSVSSPMTSVIASSPISVQRRETNLAQPLFLPLESFLLRPTLPGGGIFRTSSLQDSRFLSPPTHRPAGQDLPAPPSPSQSPAAWSFRRRPDGSASRTSFSPVQHHGNLSSPRFETTETASVRSSQRRPNRQLSPDRFLSDDPTDFSVLLNSENFLAPGPNLPFIPTSPRACLRELLHSRSSHPTFATDTSSIDIGGFDRTRSAGSMDKDGEGSLLQLLSGCSVHSRRSLRSNTQVTLPCSRPLLRHQLSTGCRAQPLTSPELSLEVNQLDAQLSMDLESHINPIFSCTSNLTSPAGILFSSDSPSGGSFLAANRSRSNTHSQHAPHLRHTFSSTFPSLQSPAGSIQPHLFSRASTALGLSTHGVVCPGGHTASSSEAPRTADTDEEPSPRQQALLVGRCSTLPVTQKRRARYVRSGSLNLDSTPAAMFECVESRFGVFVPSPPSPITRVSTPVHTLSATSQSVYSHGSQSREQVQPNSVASLDPSVSSRGGSTSTVVEHLPSRERAVRDSHGNTVKEAGNTSRTASRAPMASGQGSSHSSLHNDRPSDLIQPQSYQHTKKRHSSIGHSYLLHPQPHQQQHHSSLGSRKHYSSKYATSCSSRSSADSGGLHATTGLAVTHGPAAGMFLNMRNRNSVDNSLTLSSTSPSPSAYASTQHSERDTHRSFPTERRGSGSGGSRDRSSSAYTPNHGRMTHTFPDLVSTPHRPPRNSAQMEVHDDESNSNTRWRSKLSSGSGSPQGQSRRPSAVVHSHYVDIASLV